MNEQHTAVTRRKFLRQAAWACAGLAAPALLSGTPVEAGGLFSPPSPDAQKKAGNDAAGQILKQYKEVTDARAAHFNDLGQRLVAALPDGDRKTWDYKFHVLDSKEVNAFALPGGNMFMFTGLYEKMNSDDELAAVTGHEMTHVRMQHWAKAYAKEEQRQVGLTALLLIFHASNSNVANLTASIYDSATSLHYSRDEEDQADAGGLQNMVAAGYNPEGMIQLFETLQKVSGNGGFNGSDFLSDHPLTSTRIDHARQRIATLEKDHTFPPLTPLNYKRLMDA